MARQQQQLLDLRGHTNRSEVQQELGNDEQDDDDGEGGHARKEPVSRIWASTNIVSPPQPTYTKSSAAAVQMTPSRRQQQQQPFNGTSPGQGHRRSPRPVRPVWEANGDASEVVPQGGATLRVSEARGVQLRT
jgi:hypothetical protein